MFGQTSAKVMSEYCRVLGSNLRAGRSLVDALRSTSNRGSAPSRRISQAILTQLDAGHDLADAIDHAGVPLPPLFASMAKAAGQTGHFPEVLRELERYYDFQVRLRRKFLSQISWPIIQLVIAIFVVALLIFVLGFIGGDFDPLGLGLRGGSGAIIWLVCAFGSIGLAVLGWNLLRSRFGQGQWLDGLVLRIPVLGPCLETLTLGRLAFAMHMTLDSNLSTRKAMALAFDAAGNQAYLREAEGVLRELKRRQSLSAALEQHPRLPREFLDTVANSEESGSVPEAMKRLATEYSERAEFQLQILNTAVGWLVWCLVALLIIFFVFRLALSYVRMIESFL